MLQKRSETMRTTRQKTYQSWVVHKIRKGPDRIGSDRTDKTDKTWIGSERTHKTRIGWDRTHKTWIGSNSIKKTHIHSLKLDAFQITIKDDEEQES